MAAEVRDIVMKGTRRPHIGLALMNAAEAAVRIEDVPLPDRTDVAITALTLAELLTGVPRVPNGGRKSVLAASAHRGRKRNKTTSTGSSTSPRSALDATYSKDSHGQREAQKCHGLPASACHTDFRTGLSIESGLECVVAFHAGHSRHYPGFGCLRECAGAPSLEDLLHEHPAACCQLPVQDVSPCRTQGITCPVLHGVPLSAAPGELMVIVGPSGPGESTLLYCLAGLEAPTPGTVTLGGVDLSSPSRSQLASLRRVQLGFVFQQFNLASPLSAWENVALPALLSCRRVPSAGIDEALASAGLGAHARKHPGQLSGGQQQQVAMARVLAQRPPPALAVEPTGSLDTANGADVLRLLGEGATAGSVVVIVTHDLEAAALADRVLALRDGAIHTELHSPTPDDVLAAVCFAGTAVAGSPPRRCAQPRHGPVAAGIRAGIAARHRRCPPVGRRVPCVGP